MAASLAEYYGKSGAPVDTKPKDTCMVTEDDLHKLPINNLGGGL